MWCDDEPKNKSICFLSLSLAFEYLNRFPFIITRSASKISTEKKFIIKNHQKTEEKTLKCKAFRMEMSHDQPQKKKHMYTHTHTHRKSTMMKN